MTTALAVPTPTAPGLQRLEEACRLLAEARSIDEVKAIRDMAEAARVYARQAQLGLNAQNHAAEIKLRAERRAGELLAEMPKRDGGDAARARLHDVTELPPRLEDIGISRAQSHRWQAIASLPEQTFEGHIIDTKERGQEITTASTLRLAAERQRLERPIPSAAIARPAELAKPARVRILVGDVRAGLASLAAESVQTVPTSVPYWGLRSYGTDPQVWGGEPEHTHEWGPELVVKSNAYAPGEGVHWNHRVNGRGETRPIAEAAVHVDGKQGAFCECGAWLGELGNEPTPELYVEHIVQVFRHLWRVLKKDGTVWLNIGFSYAGSGKGPTGWSGAGDQVRRQGFGGGGFSVWRDRSGPGGAPGYKPKDLIPIPWLVAMALQQEGWYWRSTIAWCKKAPMPESVDDRPTSAWEPILLLSKSRGYFYDADAVREEGAWDGQSGHRAGPRVVPTRVGPPDMGLAGIEPGTRNMRNVWLLGPEPFPGAHFAVFPTEVPRRCILAGSRPGDLVLDPFAGAGTTLMVAARLGRDAVGIELKPEYAQLALARIQRDAGFTAEVEMRTL